MLCLLVSFCFQATLVGFSAIFLTIARFAMPIRIAGALALTPFIERHVTPHLFFLKRNDDAKTEKTDNQSKQVVE